MALSSLLNSRRSFSRDSLPCLGIAGASLALAATPAAFQGRAANLFAVPPPPPSSHTSNKIIFGAISLWEASLCPLSCWSMASHSRHRDDATFATAQWAVPAADAHSLFCSNETQTV